MLSYLILISMSFLVTVMLVFWIWRSRSLWGTRYFLIALALVAVWVGGQAGEMISTNLSAKLFWANVQYGPISLLPVVYFHLAAQFSGRASWHERMVFRVMVLVPPIVLNSLIWTDVHHGLIRDGFHLVQGPWFPIVGKVFGPLFWVFGIYNFGLSFAAMALLAVGAADRGNPYRKQAVFLFFGYLFPLAATVVHLMGLNPVFGIDWTPLLFSFSGLVIAWGVYRHDLFEILPVAHSMVLERMDAGIMVLDVGDRILEANPSACRILDKEEKALLGHSIRDSLGEETRLLELLDERDASPREIPLGGEANLAVCEVSTVELSSRRGRPIGWLVQIYDVTRRKAREDAMRHAAFHDPLTGLPNRGNFQFLFERALADEIRREGFLGVGFLDIDGMKHVNDVYGHGHGDRVLCEAGDRLRKALRETDTVARIGGDEFALLLPGLSKREAVDAIAGKIESAFSEPADIYGISIKIEASVGFAVFPVDGQDFHELLKKADQAMYRQKSTGDSM